MPRKFFYEQGYYIAKGLIPEASVAAALADIRKIFSQQINIPDSSLFQQFKALKDKDTGVYLSTLRLASHLHSIYNLCLHENISRQIKEFGNDLQAHQTSPVFHIMSEGLKLEGGYNGLSPHQDWTSTRASLGEIITWIPLVDTGPDNYPLELIPKSHLWGLASGKMVAANFEIDQSYYKESDFLGLEAGVGDVVFMTSFTAHRSGIIGPKDSVRLSASIRYTDAGDESFINRGYPCTQKRITEWGSLKDDVIPKEQVLEFFRNKTQ